jgi:hypothetical protein
VKILERRRGRRARSRVPVREAGTTGGPAMADVGYAILLLGGFALLVATLRGLAQL